MSLPSSRLFSIRPDHLIPDFYRHLKETAEPHTWRYHSHEAPARDGVEVLIKDFHLPKGSERAPCPICRPTTPWYAHGHVLWCPSSGKLHAVGHCCGHGYFTGDAFSRGLADHRKRLSRKRDEDFLEANWIAPSAVVSAARTVAPIARSYDRLAREVRAGLGHPLAKALHRMVATSGPLVLTEDVHDVSQPGVIHAVSRTFSSQQFHGGPFLKPGRSNSLEGSVKSAAIVLDHLGWTDEEAVISWLMTRSDEDLALLARRLREAAILLADGVDAILALRKFLEPSNLELLTAWSKEAHGHQAVRMFRPSENTMAVWRGGERVRHWVLPANLWDQLPKVPEMVIAEGQLKGEGDGEVSSTGGRAAGGPRGSHDVSA